MFRLLGANEMIAVEDLNDAEQKLFNQAVKEYDTGMVAVKIARETQLNAKEGDDPKTLYVALRYKQLRKQSLDQQRKVARIRKQLDHPLIDENAQPRSTTRTSDHVFTIFLVLVLMALLGAAGMIAYWISS